MVLLLHGLICVVALIGLFSVLHKYFFIRSRAWREGMQIGINTLMLIVAVSGLWLWFRMRRIRPAPTRVRAIHSRVGLVAFVAVVLGAGSGVLHTAMVLLSDSPPTPQPATAPRLSEAIDIPQILPDATAIAVRQVEGQPVYQYRYADEQLPDYYHAQDGDLLPNGEERYAQSIASMVIGEQPHLLRHKHAFDLDYGRINKFLPASEWQATQSEHAGKIVHVSTVTGNITRSTSAWDRAQIRMFSWLHSMTWLPEPLRTIVLMLLGSSIIIVTVLGLWLYRPWARLKTR